MNHAALIPPDVRAMAIACGVSPHTVRSWKQRDSIPHEKWPALIAAGFATLEQLAPDLAQVLAPSAKRPAA